MSALLIQAHKAIFNGDRAAARRILEDYRASHEHDSEEIQWLTAHAQDDYEVFMQGLYQLIEHGNPDNHYVKMARDYINEEHELRAKVTPPRRTQSRLFLASGTIALILLTTWIVYSSFFSNRPAANEEIATEDSGIVQQDIATQESIDRSQVLFGDTYTARFSSGIIQIMAVEDRSERVRYSRDDSLATPVPGARFVAISILFECRDGICREPPQAELFLELDGVELTENRSDVYISDMLDLQPVALGRSTEGWIIFEVPVLNRPTALVIRPLANDSGTRPPDIIIDLPIF